VDNEGTERIELVDGGINITDNINASGNQIGIDFENKEEDQNKEVIPIDEAVLGLGIGSGVP